LTGSRPGRNDPERTAKPAPDTRKMLYFVPDDTSVNRSFTVSVSGRCCKAAVEVEGMMRT